MFSKSLTICMLAPLLLWGCSKDDDPVPASIEAPTVNHAPIANAGVDRTVRTDMLVNVVVEGQAPLGTDQDVNDILTYTWTLTPDSGLETNAVLADASTERPSFTPDVDGIYVLTLVVNDGHVNSAEDSVTITAVAKLPPVANAGLNQTVEPGTEVVLNGAGSSDEVGSIFTYSWTIKAYPVAVPVDLVDENKATARFTPSLEAYLYPHLHIAQSQPIPPTPRPYT